MSARCKRVTHHGHVIILPFRKPSVAELCLQMTLHDKVVLTTLRQPRMSARCKRVTHHGHVIILPFRKPSVAELCLQMTLHDQVAFTMFGGPFLAFK